MNYNKFHLTSPNYNSIMPDYTSRVRQFLSYDLSLEEIREFLIADGLSEYQAFLTYMGGKLLFDNDNQ